MKKTLIVFGLAGGIAGCSTRDTRQGGTTDSNMGGTYNGTSYPSDNTSNPVDTGSSSSTPENPASDSGSSGAGTDGTGSHP